MLHPYEEIGLESLEDDSDIIQLPELQFLLLLQDRYDDPMIQQRIKHLQLNNHAEKMQSMSAARIAAYRLPAILLTLTLEMIVGFVIARFHSFLERQIAMTSFLPVLSSIAGNVGLQSSAATLRGISTGYVQLTRSSILKWILREMVATTTIGFISGTMLGLIAFIWKRRMGLSLVTGISVFCGTASAGLLGSIGPFLFRSLGVDPALLAGPFETAIQDLIGTGVYLSLGAAFL
jgi:Mg/Co/Ni transporter MgtE